ncbi:MAG: hypothetical protein AB7I79_15195 [Rhizobiaceae bacterium]
MIAVNAANASAKKAVSKSPSAYGGTPVIIVLGLDESGKSHASWFGAADKDLATKASGLMGMATLAVDSDAIRLAADKLPKGKVFASGKAFVPFVKMSLYEKLVAFMPEADRPKKPAARKASADSTAASTPQPKRTLPEDWDKIVVGSLVLASVSPVDPWYKCVVVEDKGDGLFVLKWRDYRDPNIVRRREDIALLHPGNASA